MNKCFWGAVLVTLVCTALAGADTMISIDSHFVDPSVDFYDVDVLLSPIGGGPPDVYKDAVFNLFTGDGNPPAPLVTEVVKGAIYLGKDASIFPNGVTLPARQVSYSINLNIPGDTVEADGSLATFTLDLTPLAPGDSFALDPTVWGGTMLFLSGGGVVPVQYLPGSITITPEPGTLVLSTMGLLFGLAWMGRRRKSKA